MLGRLLVAPPSQNSEYWAETIVFIYEENPMNTVGLILNKPSDKALSDLADHHDLDYDGEEMLYIGGPVNSSALVMLHTDDWTCTNTMQVEGSSYRISSDRSMLQRICAGDRPSKWRMFLGMSAWTPEQLAGEIAGDPPWNKRAAWLTADATPEIIFGRGSLKTWKLAIDGAAQNLVQNYFHID